MALTAGQIITIATQIAKVPGYQSQAVMQLNAILGDLAREYDFEVLGKYYTFPFSLTPAPGAQTYSYALGSGPEVMPSDFVRLLPQGSYYMISGVPYNMVAVRQAQFNQFVQQAGLNSFPTYFYIDHGIDQAVPAMFIWPPPSGAFTVSIFYQSLPADLPVTILDANDTTVPWFPNAVYLYTRLAGELCKISNDDRYTALLSDKDGSGGAGELLRKYLTMQGEPNDAVKTVELDRRVFRPNTANLRNTKTMGW